MAIIGLLFILGAGAVTAGAIYDGGESATIEVFGLSADTTVGGVFVVGLATMLVFFLGVWLLFSSMGRSRRKRMERKEARNRQKQSVSQIEEERATLRAENERLNEQLAARRAGATGATAGTAAGAAGTTAAATSRGDAATTGDTVPPPTVGSAPIPAPPTRADPGTGRSMSRATGSSTTPPTSRPATRQPPPARAATATTSEAAPSITGTSRPGREPGPVPCPATAAAHHPAGR